MRTSSATPLALGAVLVEGLLAGASLNRSIVELPAFRRIGASAWATYSRDADLRNGRFWYPGLAITGAALTIALALSRPSLRPAAALAMAGLLVTALAGPNVARIGRDRNPTVAAYSFTRFRRWQAVRATLQASAFFALVLGGAGQ